MIIAYGESLYKWLTVCVQRWLNTQQYTCQTELEAERNKTQIANCLEENLIYLVALYYADKNHFRSYLLVPKPHLTCQIEWKFTGIYTTVQYA